VGTDRECAIAIVGAYGNGKSSLSTALSAVLDLPRVHATPWRCSRKRRGFPSRTAPTSNSSSWSHAGSSSGSPPRARPRTASSPTARCSTAEILDRIATEAGTYAAQTYTAFVHVPNERPLDDEPAPISEAFRDLLDVRMLSVVEALGTPVIRVKGDQAQRLSLVTQQLGVLQASGA
jgi:hypothetical protein